MSVEKSANPEKLSDLNPFAVLINFDDRAERLKEIFE
jgi:hypothetical protein